jgi:muramoyltetrapeptide carboxypeptidase
MTVSSSLITPARIKNGSHIRVIAPSSSSTILNKEQCDLAIQKLQSSGFKISFSKHYEENDSFTSSSVESRLNDLHDAFRDKTVDVILTAIGGENSIQLLEGIDYALLQANPKIICGYSDITVLLNAIYQKTGYETYMGPHFSTFGQKYGSDYTMEYFLKTISSNEGLTIVPSQEWSDDHWYQNQESRTFIPNSGWWIINEGQAEGISLGGHIGTMCLSKGTSFFPSLKDSILFLEECDPNGLLDFDRELSGLILLSDFKDVKALIIGRFQKAANVTQELLQKILLQKTALQNIPIIANVDFGHTDPKITIPIGRKVLVDSNAKQSTIIFSPLI